jgi:hypothetical protein
MDFHGGRRVFALKTAEHRPLFRTAGHTVRTQNGVTASVGQRCRDVELRSDLQDDAGRQSLVFDLSMTHDRFGSSSHVQQNGLLSHPQELDAPLRLAAQRKINSYRQQYADNQNISFPSVRLADSFQGLPDAHVTVKYLTPKSKSAHAAAQLMLRQCR